jgi:ankyrin repeat protein
MADSSGRTPLWWATWREDISSVRILLGYGANANIAPIDGSSPLMMALLSSQAEIITLLLHSNASVIVQDTSGLSALHYWASGRTMGPKEEVSILKQL